MYKLLLFLSSSFSLTHSKLQSGPPPHRHTLHHWHHYSSSSSFFWWNPQADAHLQKFILILHWLIKFIYSRYLFKMMKAENSWFILEMWQNNKTKPWPDLAFFFSLETIKFLVKETHKHTKSPLGAHKISIK